MAQTLDQQRAALAWGYAAAGVKQHGTEYKGLAKGAPALIMNSGLMPTLAFYADKNFKQKSEQKVASKASQVLLDHLLDGFLIRLKPNPKPVDFQGFMLHFQEMSSSDYMRYTDEALELLKWIRQFVDAVEQKQGEA